MTCAVCKGAEWVSENQPDRPSAIVSDDLEAAGGAGMPCKCNPMSQAHSHEWAHSPTIGYFQCLRCGERVEHTNPRYKEMLEAGLRLIESYVTPEEPGQARCLMVRSVATALYDAFHSARLSEHPEDLARYEKHAVDFMRWLGVGGYTIRRGQP